MICLLCWCVTTIDIVMNWGMYDVSMHIYFPINMLNEGPWYGYDNSSWWCYLACLTNCDYDMLISQMMVVMKGYSYPKHKVFIIILIEEVNQLWTMIRFINKRWLQDY